MTTMTRTEILETLRNNRTRISYTKANGETVTRTATLMETAIPEGTTTSEIQSADTTSDAVRYYDLDKSAYRTFNINNIRSVEIIS